jgi:hypothetical protein
LPSTIDFSFRQSKKKRKFLFATSLKEKGKIPQQIFHQTRQMKPIESALMEPENPRVYRLVLTGGQW